jgi:protein disulfide-isomerase
MNTSTDQGPEKLWQTNVQEAIEISKETGKPIFAFFTGKEWCSWCKKLDQQILSQPPFIEYAKENLILLELDFPRGRRDLPKEQLVLARKFKIQGYPTVIVMDSETNLLGQTGFEYMTPEQYVTHIQSFIKNK